MDSSTLLFESQMLLRNCSHPSVLYEFLQTIMENHPEHLSMICSLLHPNLHITPLLSITAIHPFFFDHLQANQLYTIFFESNYKQWVYKKKPNDWWKIVESKLFQFCVFHLSQFSAWNELKIWNLLEDTDLVEEQNNNWEVYFEKNQLQFSIIVYLLQISITRREVSNKLMTQLPSQQVYLQLFCVFPLYNEEALGFFSLSFLQQCYQTCNQLLNTVSQQSDLYTTLRFNQLLIEKIGQKNQWPSCTFVFTPPPYFQLLQQQSRLSFCSLEEYQQLLRQPQETATISWIQQHCKSAFEVMELLQFLNSDLNSIEMEQVTLSTMEWQVTIEILFWQLLEGPNIQQRVLFCNEYSVFLRRVFYTWIKVANQKASCLIQYIHLIWQSNASIFQLQHHNDNTLISQVSVPSPILHHIEVIVELLKPLSVELNNSQVSSTITELLQKILSFMESNKYVNLFPSCSVLKIELTKQNQSFAMIHEILLIQQWMYHFSNCQQLHTFAELFQLDAQLTSDKSVASHFVLFFNDLFSRLLHQQDCNVIYLYNLLEWMMCCVNCSQMRSSSASFSIPLWLLQHFFSLLVGELPHLLPFVNAQQNNTILQICIDFILLWICQQIGYPCGKYFHVKKVIDNGSVNNASIMPIILQCKDDQFMASPLELPMLLPLFYHCLVFDSQFIKQHEEWLALLQTSPIKWVSNQGRNPRQSMFTLLKDVLNGMFRRSSLIPQGKAEKFFMTCAKRYILQVIYEWLRKLCLNNIEDLGTNSSISISELLHDICELLKEKYHEEILKDIFKIIMTSCFLPNGIGLQQILLQQEFVMAKLLALVKSVNHTKYLGLKVEALKCVNAMISQSIPDTSSNNPHTPIIFNKVVQLCTSCHICAILVKHCLGIDSTTSNSGNEAYDLINESIECICIILAHLEKNDGTTTFLSDCVKLNLDTKLRQLIQDVNFVQFLQRKEDGQEKMNNLKKLEEHIRTTVLY